MQTILNGDELARALLELGASPSILSDSRSCLGATLGGYPGNCETRDHWDLLWIGSVLPWWLAPLSVLAGGRRCVVNFTHGDGLSQFADEAADYEVQICSCSSSHIAAILRHLQDAGRHASLRDIVRQDPTHLLWEHLADSEDWCHVTVTCGSACPADLVEYVRKIEHS